MESTRYSTGYQLSFVFNAFVNLGIMKDDMPISQQVLDFGSSYEELVGFTS